LLEAVCVCWHKSRGKEGNEKYKKKKRGDKLRSGMKGDKEIQKNKKKF